MRIITPFFIIIIISVVLNSCSSGGGSYSTDRPGTAAGYHRHQFHPYIPPAKTYPALTSGSDYTPITTEQSRSPTVQPASHFYRSNGTYVAPYHRSALNSTTSDNYSTYGNTNPYTGQPGRRH